MLCNSVCGWKKPRRILVPVVASCLVSLFVMSRAAYSETLYLSGGIQSVARVSSTGVVSSYATLPWRSFPEGLAFDGSGNLYVADGGSDQISKIIPGGTVSLFASSYAGDPVTGGAIPVGIAFDGGGNLFVANVDAGQISKITPDGAVSIFASAYFPSGLAFDGGGNLYVESSHSGQISKITPDGTTTIFATLPVGGGPLAFDGSGNLYGDGYDGGAGQISKITSNGVASLFATLPAGASAGSLAFDGSGNLYVLGGGQISVISPDGRTVSPFADVGDADANSIAFGPDLPGDANGDGLINLDDYLAVDHGFLNHLAGLSNGDFNNDGTIDAADYAILDAAYLSQDGPESASEIALHTAEFGPAYANAPQAIVPEPGSAELLAATLVPLLCARRKRTHAPRLACSAGGLVKKG